MTCEECGDTKTCQHCSGSGYDPNGLPGDPCPICQTSGNCPYCKKNLNRLPTPDYHTQDDRAWQAWDFTRGQQKFYVETVKDEDGWRIGYMAIAGENNQHFGFWLHDYLDLYKDAVIEFLSLYHQTTGKSCTTPKGIDP